MVNNSSHIDHNPDFDYILFLRLIVWGYVGMALSLFGIVGNLITIIVLISPSMRTTSTNIYLTALSCSNIFFLLIFIPSYSMRYLIGYRLYVTNQPPFTLEILLARLPTTPVYNTILLSIIYLTIAVSIDRLILIKFPLKARQILTQRATLTTILCIYLFSIVYCIPYWFEKTYVPELKHCQRTAIGKKIHKYTGIYIYIPIVYLIPFGTLTCINITIIQNLIAKKRRQQSLGTKANKKKQADYYITLMLVTVIIVFVLSQLPLLVLNAWLAIDPFASLHSFSFNLLNIIGTLLIVLNTSTNFLLYCFFGQKFRQTLIGFVSSLIPHRNQRLDSQTRLLKSSDKQKTFGQESKERTTTSSISIKNEHKINKNKSNETGQQIFNEILNQNQEQICPLIGNSDKLPIIHENIQLKQNQQFNLCTCSNGQTILLLKI